MHFDGRCYGAAQVNFINHFSGCQLCTQQNKEGDYAECEAEFVKSFEFADAAFGKALKRAPPRNISLDAQLAATPYCQVRRGGAMNEWMDHIYPAARADEDKVDASSGASSRAPSTSEQSMM